MEASAGTLVIVALSAMWVVAAWTVLRMRLLLFDDLPTEPVAQTVARHHAELEQLARLDRLENRMWQTAERAAAAHAALSPEAVRNRAQRDFAGAPPTSTPGTAATLKGLRIKADQRRLLG